MWLDPKEISKWAYSYCLDIEDRLKIRKLITDSHWAFYYCRYIKDRPEMRKLIKRSYFTNKPNIINKGGKNVVRS